MKKSFLIEIGVLLLAVLSGLLLGTNKIVSVIIAFLLLVFNSYFAVTELKKQTIVEYKEAIKQQKETPFKKVKNAYNSRGKVIGTAYKRK